MNVLLRIEEKGRCVRVIVCDGEEDPQETGALGRRQRRGVKD